MLLDKNNIKVCENGIFYKGDKQIKEETHDISMLDFNNNRIKLSKKKIYYALYNKVLTIDNIKDLDGEQWKVINNTNGNYLISNKGRVKSLKQYNAKILKAYHSGNRYLKVKINKKDYYIHRLVGEYFIINDDIKADTIHHKDRNRQNNNVNNLQWLTRGENSRLAHQKE